MILCTCRTPRSREQSTSARKVCLLYDQNKKDFVIIKHRRHILEKYIGAQRFVGFFSWLCYSGADWLGWQTLITWPILSKNKTNLNTLMVPSSDAQAIELESWQNASAFILQPATKGESSLCYIFFIHILLCLKHVGEQEQILYLTASYRGGATPRGEGGGGHPRRRPEFSQGKARGRGERHDKVKVLNHDAVILYSSRTKLQPTQRRFELLVETAGWTR